MRTFSFSTLFCSLIIKVANHGPTRIIFKMTAPSFINNSNELFSFNVLLNLKCCQQSFTNVLFCTKVGIIRNEIIIFFFLVFIDV